jgi:hypothetical protein
MRKIKHYSRNTTVLSLVFLILLSVWILLSITSIIINGFKAISQESKLLILTDSQKKYLIFGDLYLFFSFVETNTPKHASIILYPHTEEIFYRGIYELYPRITYTAKNVTEVERLIRTKSPDYIAVYNKTLTVNNYEQLASFSGKQSNFGILYKRK